MVQVEFPTYALPIHMPHKIAKLDKEPFCYKVIFLHDASSCTCSIYLYCIRKVSESLVKALVQVDFPVYALPKQKETSIQEIKA